MRKALVMLLVAGSFGLAACSKSKEPTPPVVGEIKQTEQARPTLPGVKVSASAADPALRTMIASSSRAVVTEITLNKAQLFNRAFLYGVSIQFSSIPDEELSLSYMGLALGQLPVEFRLVDDKLRLVSDARIGFESDVNHPSRLVHEFQVLRQDETTLTVRASQASPMLEPFLQDRKTNIGKHVSFVRSMEYVAEDELLLIESTIEMQNGAIAEFMETLTPRERVVPEGVKPISADADVNPAAGRFRFIDAGKVFVDSEGKRVPTKMAARFLQKNGEPVKWYVTRNIPEKYIVDVKNSVEAWNRYSRAAGQPDLVRFEGLLPEGVKIGDPRYNLLLWDNVQEAGAAYESQNADPLTGIQSHSMIYIPLAWVNIAKQYWEAGSHTEAKAEARLHAMSQNLAQKTLLGRKLPVHCLDGAHLHIALQAKHSPDEFARGLLKGVVFHEMGHALGLSHNFKGSLVYDADDRAKPFSTSIMDYNHYNEEDGAFTSHDSADGPLLEYDRQIISVLYNDAKDVKEADPVLPACDDPEADSFAGGVDPLCLRYDIGADPTKQALRSLDLLGKADARNGRMVSLPAALRSTVGELPAPGEAKNAEELTEALAKFVKVANGTASLYIGGTANSLAYLGSQAVKSLFVFRPDSLPEGYVENEMRERALTLLETVSATSAYPTATKEALQQTRAELATWLAQSTVAAGMGEEDRTKLVQSLLSKADASFAANEQAVLSRARTRILGALAHQADAPLSFHVRDGKAVDVEAAVLNLIEAAAQAKAGEVDRPAAERAAAITALLSYNKAGIGRDVTARLKETLNVEVRTATDARKRATLRKLLAMLQ